MVRVTQTTEHVFMMEASGTVVEMNAKVIDVRMKLCLIARIGAVLLKIMLQMPLMNYTINLRWDGLSYLNLLLFMKFL